MNQWHALLIQAISERKALRIRYDGHERLVEPHAYGISRAGTDCVRVWQVSGRSNSGPVPDWRLLTVRNITSAAIAPDPSAAPRDGYRPGDRHMRTIYAQL